jgi:hypothetical protein
MHWAYYLTKVTEYFSISGYKMVHYSCPVYWLDRQFSLLVGLLVIA